MADRIAAIEREPLPSGIPRLLEEAVAKDPDGVAWNFFQQGRDITYRDLLRQVDRLANAFLSLGLRHGSRVAVMLPNVPEMPGAWLALTRIGAVMVPVNTRYTAREIAYVLATSEADGLVVHADYLPVVGGIEQGRMPLLGILVGGSAAGYLGWDELLALGGGDPCPAPFPELDDVANIQFTSGTTGLPKGCILSHRYWLTCAKIHARQDFLPLKRFLSQAPFFYMTSQWMLLSAFYQAGTLYVADRPSASRFAEWAARHRIHFSLFDEAVYRQPAGPYDRQNAYLRANIYGHRKENHRDLENRFRLRAREGFGMTEVGAALSMPIEADEMTGSGSIGIPTAFRQCRVADEDGRESPPDRIGELQVRGAGLFSGYYGDPAATAAAFDGDWFKTGDLATRDGRGFFYFVGRAKDMIRRSGENIASREVESVVDQIPQIAESAAVPVPDPERGEEVKVYVVLKDGQTIAPEAIIAACAKELAVFKLPRYIEYRTEPLPRSPTGTKVVKSALLRDRTDLRAGCWDRIQGRWL